MLRNHPPYPNFSQLPVDELLDREIFYTLKEAQILIEDWRRYYNTKRPHSALNYRPPAPETIMGQPLATLSLALT